MKTFLSIGSGPGIGLATAERFAREGYRVVLTSRRDDYLSQVVNDLRAGGHTAEGRHVDASNVESVSKLVKEVESEFGSIDVLHFNSAAMHGDDIVAQSVETFIADLSTNVGSAFAAVKQASVGMVNRKSGTLLLTGGIFAVAPNRDYVSLSVGKAGLRNLVLGLFEPLKENGVHIGTVTVGALVAARSTQATEVADTFWDIHAQEQADWVAEVAYGDMVGNV